MTAPKEYIGADAERITRLFQEQHAEIERLRSALTGIAECAEMYADLYTNEKDMAADFVVKARLGLGLNARTALGDEG